MLCWCVALCIELGHAFLPKYGNDVPSATVRLQEELRYLERKGSITQPPVSVLRIYTHLNDILEDFSNEFDRRIQRLDREYDARLFSYDYWHRISATTHLVLLRVCVLASFLPTLLIWVALAVVDGLVQRGIRRYRGGRESAAIYHAAKRFVKPLAAWTCLIYLCVPMLVNPLTVYVPLVVAMPIAVYLASSRFKKYL